MSGFCCLDRIDRKGSEAVGHRMVALRIVKLAMVRNVVGHLENYPSNGQNMPWTALLGNNG